MCDPFSCAVLCEIKLCQFSSVMNAVESPKIGHFWTALLVLCKEVVLLGGITMYKQYMEKLY